MLWERVFPNLLGLDVAVFGNECVYYVGRIHGQVDFDPSDECEDIITPAQASMFLLKLTPDGYYW